MRQKLIDTVVSAVRSVPSALAAWEAGSKSFGRDDDLSDVDLAVVVKDGEEHVQAMVQAFESALPRFAPVDLRWEVPRPAWHGHWQAFYRFKGVSPLLLLDIAVIQKSSANWLCEPEVHGTAAHVFFDDDKLLPTKRLDKAAHAESLRRAVDRIRVTSEMFHPFVEKEMRRDRPMDALAFYQSLVLARLIEALRIRYCPQRSTFANRYLKDDLPPEVAERYTRLAYVPGPEKLLAHKDEALAWLREILGEYRTDKGSVE